MSDHICFENDLFSQIATYEKVICKFIKPGQRYSLLDFPNHSNIGDSIIYLGELLFFKKNIQCGPTFVADNNVSVDQLFSLLPKGPVFIHGGGNFGDIWPNHQNFRLKILESLKGYKIIQLPQSIHFSDSKQIEKTAKAIADHGNFTLLVRDKSSMIFAEHHFDCPIYLAPDAACMLLNHITYKNIPTINCLAMLREDKEMQSSEIMNFLPKGTLVEDWNKVTVWRLRERIFNKLFINKMPLNKIKTIAVKKLFKHLAKRRLEIGVEQLSRARLIITDRLHVHLLCCLMGKAHILIDNNYGKLSRYIESWEKSENTSFVYKVEQIPEAVKAVSQTVNLRIPV